MLLQTRETFLPPVCASFLAILCRYALNFVVSPKIVDTIPTTASCPMLQRFFWQEKGLKFLPRCSGSYLSEEQCSCSLMGWTKWQPCMNGLDSSKKSKDLRCSTREIVFL